MTVGYHTTTGGGITPGVPSNGAGVRIQRGLSTICEATDVNWCPGGDWHEKFPN